MDIRQFNNIVELRTKVISMVTFVCGTAYAYFTTGSWSLPLALLMGLGVLCVDMGTTGFNTYFDFLNGTDRAERNREKDKVLVHEQVGPAAAFFVSSGLYLVAAFLGLVLASRTSWMLVPVGVVCMTVGFAYTGGPRPISRTPFGELFAGGFLGSVLFMISFFVQAGSSHLAAFVASLPFLLLVSMILSVNNTCDLESDKEAGRRTLAILLGREKAPALLYLELSASFVLSLLFSVLGIYPRSGLLLFSLSFLLSLRRLRGLGRAGFSLQTKSSSMPVASGIYLKFGIAFLLSLATDLLIRTYAS